MEVFNKNYRNWQGLIVDSQWLWSLPHDLKTNLELEKNEKNEFTPYYFKFNMQNLSKSLNFAKRKVFLRFLEMDIFVSPNKKIFHCRFSSPKTICWKAQFYYFSHVNDRQFFSCNATQWTFLFRSMPQKQKQKFTKLTTVIMYHLQLNFICRLVHLQLNFICS